MIFLFAFLLQAAAADTCQIGAVEFDFAAEADMNRALILKNNENTKFVFPRVSSGPVNLIQSRDGKGSLCSNAAAFAFGKNKIAVLFETLEDDSQSTFVAVFDFAAKAFDKLPPLKISDRSDIATEKSANGFAYSAGSANREEDALTTGIGPAAGLDMVLTDPDIWKEAVWTAKGLQIKVDAERTWKNSRWNKYITDRKQFEKVFRLSDPSVADKIQVYSAFSRQAKKDCVLVNYDGDKKAFCRPITSSNL